MPMIDADGCLLNVSVEGRDGGPTLMLSNSLGCNLQMWEPQMKALTQVFRVIRYDRRGHGKSSVPPGPYSMERFGRDVLAILDDLNIEKTHWCGLSMGGMVGQWLGANAPDRFGKIILANTACHYPDPTNWHNRIKAVKEGGIAAVADTVIAGWLTADFREREPQITANMKAMLLASPGRRLSRLLRGAVDARSARAAAEDQEPDTGHRRTSRHGDAGRGRRIHPQPDSRREHDDPRCRAYFQCRAIARLHRRRGRLPDATLTQTTSLRAQRSNPSSREESTDCFAASLLAMTGGGIMDDNKRRDDGMTQRRKVLGDEWVDKSIANRNAFNTDFQDLITRYAWGDIWTRPHFDHRTRRVLVIGTMVALGQWDEFRLHVRAALAEGGFTPDDIKEILLQQAIYCGVPAANHAVKEASAIVAELGLLKG